MPEPEDQAAQPQPLVPEDAIPGDVSAEDNAPAPVAAADNGIPDPARSDNDASGVPAGSAAEAASADDATSADDADLAEDDIPAEQMPQGLRWSWDLDFDTLIAALSEPAPWNRPVRPAPPQQASSSATEADPASDRTDPDANEDAGDSPTDSDPVEAEFAEMLDAIEANGSQPLPLAVVAGRVAESLQTGPDLAGWLATGEVAGLEDGALAGMAASYRRLASWAQAGELAVVAQLAARSAAADARIGLDADGRPARLTDDACAQVSLALTMSQAAASWWSDLAVTLTWRLQATGTALRAGEIDLGRARLIADVTGVLDEDTARAVEARVLPAAGDQTIGQLRAALRRAVIAADPEGAERRREEAERRAKVSLYPDPDGTASLAGSSLPGIRAAAAMARITALAKAMKAAGAGGGIDLLSEHKSSSASYSALCPTSRPHPAPRPTHLPPTTPATPAPMVRRATLAIPILASRPRRPTPSLADLAADRRPARGHLASRAARQNPSPEDRARRPAPRQLDQIPDPRHPDATPDPRHRDATPDPRHPDRHLPNQTPGPRLPYRTPGPRLPYRTPDRHLPD